MSLPIHVHAAIQLLRIGSYFFSHLDEPGLPDVAIFTLHSFPMLSSRIRNTLTKCRLERFESACWPPYWLSYRSCWHRICSDNRPRGSTHMARLLGPLGHDDTFNQTGPVRTVLDWPLYDLAGDLAQ